MALPRALPLLLLALLCGHCLAAAGTTEIRKKGEEKLKWLAKQSVANPIIALNPSTYKTYVASGPRPYTLILVFTALHPQVNCHICKDLRNELVPLSEWYEQYRYTKDEDSNPAFAHKIFFVEVDYQNNADIFRKLNLNSAPIVVHVPPTESANVSKIGSLFTDLPHHHQFNIGKWGLNADGIQRFIVSRTAVGSDIVPSFTPPPDYSGLLVLVSTLVLVALTGRALCSCFPSLWKFWAARTNPMFYFAISVSIYTFCISGGMYNIIRGIPFFHVGQNGQTSWLHPDGSQQLGAEGFVVGFLNVLGGMALVLLSTRGVGGSSRAERSGRLIVALLCLGAAHFFLSQIRAIYTRKNPSYNYGYVLRV